MIEVFETFHYAPHDFDKNDRIEIYLQLANYLDEHHVVFTSDEVESWIEEAESKAGQLEQFDTFTKSISNRFIEVTAQNITHVEENLNREFTFQSKDIYLFPDEQTNSWEASSETRMTRLKKFIEYQVLREMFSLSADSIQLDTPNDSITQNLASVIENIKSREKRFAEVLQDKSDLYHLHIEELMLHLIAIKFDPHSSYFSSNAKEDFEKDLSKEVLTFGFEIRKVNTGEVKVSYLQPGGPAWKSNEIHEGDQLVAIDDGKRKLKLVEDYTLFELREIVNNNQNESIILHLIKADGRNVKVTLEKEVIEVESNLIRSYVLNGERKMGYVSLPGFYTNWNPNGTLIGCANDVAKEIIKLKREGIEGLILDLRFNGGGSMKEAVDLIGTFIDAGPVVINNTRGAEKPTTLKDMNRGVMYDGPLVVLINGASASASELVASALQDYNRAIIVGGTSYGKATGQIILPLDPRMLNPAAEVEKSDDFGFAKVTVQKLYRIKGDTHQKAGVKPDILLPDFTQFVGDKERDEPYALAQDSIVKKTYYRLYPELPLEEIQSKSQNRTMDSQAFENIVQMGSRYQHAVDSIKGRIPLNIDEYKKRIVFLNQLYDEVNESLEGDVTAFVVENSAYDQEIMAVDEYKTTNNVKAIGKLEKDITLEEAYQILMDYIQLNN